MPHNSWKLLNLCHKVTKHVKLFEVMALTDNRMFACKQQLFALTWFLTSRMFITLAVVTVKSQLCQHIFPQLCMTYSEVATLLIACRT